VLLWSLHSNLHLEKTHVYLVAVAGFSLFFSLADVFDLLNWRYNLNCFDWFSLGLRLFRPNSVGVRAVFNQHALPSLYQEQVGVHRSCAYWQHVFLRLYSAGYELRWIPVDLLSPFCTVKAKRKAESNESCRSIQDEVVLGA